MEFHILRSAREKYQFDDLLFSKTGNVIFANFQAARQFAEKINAFRSKSTDKPTPVAASQINALGLIDEIFHLVVDLYYQENGPALRHNLYLELEKGLGAERLNSTLEYFSMLFPPLDVYTGKTDITSYLAGETEGIPNRELVLEELLMAWLTNVNPAAQPYAELFTDKDLAAHTAYLQVVDGIQIYFKHQPSFGPEKQDLITMLRSPALVVPQSLSGQLGYIRDHWSEIIGKYLYKLLGSLDMIKEEEKAAFFGPGESLVPDYANRTAWADGMPDVERYSPDSDWMPRVVMLAKNSYVWLNQLSRQFQRPIDRLDQIPDEVLDELARWGFSGLWLIGLWERSDASRRIKQMCGNPDAVSSAYSLARYQIAGRLGGEEAYQNLSQRCAARGIRLASDMVPNHMGIDSDWVYEHPDWFISLDYSPFPGYTFNGPDLSQRSGVSINLEDHYYSRSDAAVVFKRYDHGSGQTRYIYHGNDGTSMPWNDTAQLNYLNPQVREAVIQTILDVARRFPIIRFDAAMTLTKKHYQRLWFPQPGTGGDIPSRADFAMSREEFDRAMPEEFWREVVERVAREVPDTLLLAEAFWLMEGYFVRSLGMHRVYNSAFMNMLRNEENEKYRQLIKNTLVYDPQILKRYVNFMNNPDEKTAVEQFGKGDKYFGICTVMATLPGLPMFGHGQIEGYSEKYGMEYYRPYWDEQPDQDLLHRHEREIFPLLHRRWLFADVSNFTLYDFYRASGGVDEDVFAYSNAVGGHAGLVVYNNRFSSTAGWIKGSVPFLEKGAENASLSSRELGNALGLSGGATDYVIFRDYTHQLTYIRPVQEVFERGLYFELQAYQCHVFMDFKIVRGREYEELNRFLGGRGVPDLDAIRREIALGPVLFPLRRLLAIPNLEKLLTQPTQTESNGSESEDVIAGSLQWLTEAGYAALQLTGPIACSPEAGKHSAQLLITELRKLDKAQKSLGLAGMRSTARFAAALDQVSRIDPRFKFVMLLWSLLGNLSGPQALPECAQANRRTLDEAPISQLLIETLTQVGFSDYEAYKQAQAVKWMSALMTWPSQDPLPSAAALLDQWLGDPQFENYIEVNTYNDVRWYNKEKFDQMLTLQQAALFLQSASAAQASTSKLVETLLTYKDVFAQLEEAAQASEYQLDKLRSALA